MTAQEALDFARLNSFIAEGRLIRGSWRDTDAEGRETACLLAALYPPAGKAGSASACPAALMRPWLAELTVWIDDNGALDKWPEHIKRYAAVIPGVVALDAEADGKLSREIGVLIIQEAVLHVTVDEWGVKAACEQAIEALRSGDKKKIRAARRAARSAAAGSAARSSAAESAARSAAGSAAWSAAARSAARSAAWSAAESAAESAAGSAAWSAAESAAESAAGSAAWSAARSAAEDRMIEGMLTAMETAVASASPRGTAKETT